MACDFSHLNFNFNSAVMENPRSEFSKHPFSIQWTTLTVLCEIIFFYINASANKVTVSAEQALILHQQADGVQLPEEA